MGPSTLRRAWPAVLALLGVCGCSEAQSPPLYAQRYPAAAARRAYGYAPTAYGYAPVCTPYYGQAYGQQGYPQPAVQVPAPAYNPAPYIPTPSYQQAAGYGYCVPAQSGQTAYNSSQAAYNSAYNSSQTAYSPAYTPGYSPPPAAPPPAASPPAAPTAWSWQGSGYPAASAPPPCAPPVPPPALLGCPMPSPDPGPTVTPTFGSTTGGITIYSATWCGPCRSLESKLGERNIPFQTIDVDQNREAFRRAQVVSNKSGVPLTNVSKSAQDVWILGDDADAVEQAYKAP